MTSKKFSKFNDNFKLAINFNIQNYKVNTLDFEIINGDYGRYKEHLQFLSQFVQNKKIQEELEEKKKVSSLNDEKKNIIKEGVENSTKYYFRTILDFPSKDLPELVDKSKRELQSGVIVYFSEYNKSISIVAGVTKDITSRINAIDITKKSAEILGASGGGGRVDFARAGGGSNINKISEVYDSILDLIRNS